MQSSHLNLIKYIKLLWFMQQKTILINSSFLKKIKFEIVNLYVNIMIMEKISLDDIKTGTVLQNYIYYDNSFIVFPKYSQITKNEIERAKRFNLDTLYCSNKTPIIASTPEIETKTQKEAIQEVKAPKPKVEIEKEVEKDAYEIIVSYINKEFDSVYHGNKLELTRIFRIASSVVEYALKRRKKALIEISKGRSTTRLETHSLNTGILAALLSYELKIKAKDLINIVTGAILHDIGILFLQDKSNIEDVRKHTIYGFKYLKNIKDADPITVIPALQHHEKADGTGYPHKLLLKDFEYSTKIIAVCDSCDTQISCVKYGNDLSLHLTKEEFISWRKEDFDLSIFTSLINSLKHVFKEGASVVLNDGSIGAIKKTSIRFPLNPVIQIIADLEEPKTVELIKSKDVWIKSFI